ncbi:hypothetical protein ARMGADRAFT_1003870 [Armillaria gallica]|uniref:Peptidase C14 caspase domain-containing protein n=1 Tax=Armillaria gallica TaxID=47427 RepID=A0A2H3E6J9_ARMGA|nr:hypothetical protein ARMGADRAFT_1003870 [Armillaria gallica]
MHAGKKPSMRSKCFSVHSIDARVMHAATQRDICISRIILPQKFSMAKQCDRNVYAQLMSTLGHGYPLWRQDYDSKAPPTRVGDLGYLTDDGDFTYLFNVFADANDLSNSGRVPPDFIPLTDLPEPAVEQRLEMHEKNAVLTAYSGSNKRDKTPVRVKVEAGRGYEFTCSAAQAAILVLPDGGERYDSRFPHLLEECAAANAHRWYKYFNGAGQQLQIRNGMLYLVTGFDKCRSLGNAYYSRRSKSPSISLKFSTASTTTTGLDRSMRYSWDVHQYIHTKSYCTGPPGSLVSQTIFLRGYSISVRPDPSQSLGDGQMMPSGRSPEGSKRQRQQSSHNRRGVNKLNTDIPYSHANRQTNAPVQISAQYKIINPSVLINNHILERFSGAEIALTHDGHWMGIAGGTPFDARFVKYAMKKNLISVREIVSLRNAWVAKGTALNNETSTPIEILRTFALIIGIDRYEQTKYANLRAAVTDADRFENFLLKRLRTPREQIISLRNDQATRKGIIDGFRSLIHDQRISPGKSAIIIYYAGYGATASKPIEWKDWQTPDNKIEMLCPTDMGILDVNKNVVDGIPDRTISKLLRELATAKGNNITLILDCCHTADTSSGTLPRTPNAKPRRIIDPPDLCAGCDDAMHSRGSSVETITSGFSGSLWDSHTLLAACNRRELAWEVNGQGIFTSALLEIMGKNPINELTYRSLMHRVVMPSYQTPQLEGKHTLRRLFDGSDEPAGSSMVLCRHEPGEPHFVLHAGTPHGITVGSTFEIFRTDLPSLQYPLAIATVSKVEEFTSLLVPPDHAFLHANKNRLVWYARLLKGSGPSFDIYCNDSNLLTRIIKADCEPRFTVPVAAVRTPDKAHLCLTVKDRSVSFERGEKVNLLSPSIGFPSRFPHVSEVGDTASIRTIISRFAHFTAQLSITGPLRVTDLVSIEMKKLQRNGLSLTPVGENLLPVINDNMHNDNKPVEFFVDKSLPQNQHPRYGFTIRNNSDIDLYVYLFFFDGTSFAIDALYPSNMSRSHKEEQGAVDIRLSKDALLHLGYGNSGMNPFVFTLPDGQDVDVCFFRFIVTLEPVDLGSILQLSPFLDSTPRSLRIVSPSSDIPGSWASIVIPVIQKTAQAVVDPSSKIRSPEKSDPKTTQVVVDPPSKTMSSAKSVPKTAQAVVGPSSKIKSPEKSVPKTTQAVVDPSSKRKSSGKSVTKTTRTVVDPSSKRKSSGKSVPKTAQTVVDPPSKTTFSAKSVQGPRWWARLKNILSLMKCNARTL